MLTLSKQFAISVQGSKPFRSLKLINLSEHIYLTTRRHSLSELSSTGKLKKLLISQKKSKILISGVSDCSSLIGGLTSTGQILIFSKDKRVIQSFLLPPQLKLSIDIMKPDRCSLSIFDKGVILIAPNDQIWLWKGENSLKNPKSLSPYIKGIWVHLNSSNILRSRSEVSTWRSNISESKQNSNSSRPTVVKSRYTSHAFSIRFSSDYIRGSIIGVLRVWLRSINEDSCTLESRFLLVNLTNREQSKDVTSWVSRAEEYIYKGPLEFWSKKGHKDMGLVARLDHTNSIAAIGVNSCHPFFCQLIFLNPTTGACVAKKLCNYATVDDNPTTSNDGQTSFWIDDIAWSPDDTLVLIAFKSGFISVFNRIGEPLNFVMDMAQGNSEARIFSHTFFTTDPESVKKHGSFLSIDWNESLIALSDGFTVFEMEMTNVPTLKELIPLYIPSYVEQPDISINISHETNPIPSEIDSGPKRKNIEQAFLLLRGCISNSHAWPSKDLMSQITNWIDNALPPQLHDEINYTVLPNSRFETEARLSNNLILKKKMHAIDVYEQFYNLICHEKWSLVKSSDFKEWVLKIGFLVFKYMLADQQALYSWNILKLFEKWSGLRLQRMRNMLVVYSLIQYRNYQANHINVSYFLIAYVAVRGGFQKYTPEILKEDEEFLRAFIKLNIDLSAQLHPKITSSLNSFYYLDNRVNEKIDGPINYILGYSSNFSDTNQEICYQLLKGNIKFIDTYISNETLLFFAYFFDPTESCFMSPIEANSSFCNNNEDIYKLLECMKKVSQVQVLKDKKYQKDSAFLYWVLGCYEKVEELLPVDMAFYAINKLVPALEKKHSVKAVKVLKRMFLMDNCLKLLELCNEDLKVLFQKYALEILRDKLKMYIEGGRLGKSARSSGCLEVYEEYGCDELIEYVRIFNGAVGEIDVLNGGTEKWIDFEKSNFVGNENMVNKTVQDILKYFWYIHIQEKISSCSNIEWRIRLLSLLDICDKTPIIQLFLQEDFTFSPESKNIISLYLRTSILQNTLETNYNKWLDRIKSTNESAYILHTLEQPAYINPWIFDGDFINFIKKLIKTPTLQINTWESVIKSWNNLIKNFSKQYKTTNFIKYQNGDFIECKELERIDLNLYQKIFPDQNCDGIIEDKTIESIYLCPIIPLKKRVSLEFCPLKTSETVILSIRSMISCKKIFNVLKMYLKNILGYMRPQRKRDKSPKLKMKRLGKGNAYFFIAKNSAQDLEDSSKPASLRFVNALESQQKVVKHRRIQSVMLPSASLEKPFQIIRVQKPTVRMEEEIL